MNGHLLDSKTQTYPYKMTLQPQLLKKEQLSVLNKKIMPLLKRQGIDLNDVGESFHYLLHPLRLEKIKEHRPFYLILKNRSYGKKPVRVLINTAPVKKNK